MTAVLRPLLLALAASLVVVIGAAAPASACSCAERTTEEYVDDADVVVLGEVENINLTKDDQYVTVKVRRVYKEDLGYEIGEYLDFATASSGAACGLEGIEVGQTTLFLLTEEDGMLTASACGGTGQVTEAQAIDLLGEGRVPIFVEPEPVEPAGWAALGLGLAAAAGAVGLLLWGRRRQQRTAGGNA